MVLPKARPGGTYSFVVLARRKNQNRMAIGVGMVSHALLLRSADGAQVAALGNQGHRRQSRHIYGPTFDVIIAEPPLRSATHRPDSATGNGTEPEAAR